MKQSVYVAVIGTGQDGDPWRPDLPEGIAWSAEIPADLTDSPNYCPPAVTYCRVHVDGNNIGLIKKTIKKSDVPIHDRTLIACYKALNPNNPNAFSNVRRAIKAINNPTIDEKKSIKKVISHLIRMGWPPIEAESVSNEIGL